MRTDVKLGIVTSMVVVLTAGGYFLFRGDSQAPIPLADQASPGATKSAAKPPAGKQPAINPSRQITSTKDAPAKASQPVNREPKVATKPTERLPVTTPKERTPDLTATSARASAPLPQQPAEPMATGATIPVYRGPVVEPKTDAQAVPPIAVPSPVERTALAERSPESASPTPVTSPAGAAPGAVPNAVTSRESESGFASRTLMAGNEPVKPASTTPIVEKLQRSGTPSETKLDFGKAAADTHRVQPGDSLASLAQTYYGNAKYAGFLAESNPGISDPAKLALGATIKIPPLPSDIDTRMANATPAKAPSSATGSATDKRTYKVKSGDSFYKIAKEQLGNAERWKELLELNKTLVHGDPTALQPGQTLVLPNS